MDKSTAQIASDVVLVPPGEASRLQIEQALSGDARALRELIRELTPVVQARVARVLVRAGGCARGGALRQDVADFTQDVLASLFADEGRILRSFRVDGGMGLRGFVGLVAERDAISRVRSRKRSPMTEAPTDDEALERALGSTRGEENAHVDRALLTRVVSGLEAALSPLGMRVFQELFVHERTVEEASVSLEMSADAVYQWRTRIRRSARELAHAEGYEVTR